MPGSRTHRAAAGSATGFIDPVSAFDLPPGCVIAGIDEVGRGALAGPVTAAAVILRPEVSIPGLADSKTLTARRRERVAADIRASALSVTVAHVAPSDIDALGIVEATRRAMSDALAQLSVRPDIVLVDGLPVELPAQTRAVVRGDSLLAAVAAASIVAKVERDRLMTELDETFPGYAFAVHKGYGTAQHLEALHRLGPCTAHRMSFAPCSQVRLF
ncbi:MAG: ribonuclease HII [Coriobacteriia bacterium]|nr:ribonuclease HII [Coriobacteriia bacterium]